MTTRTLFIAAICIGSAFFLNGGQARAAEFCPAHVDDWHAFEGGSTHVIGVRLGAGSARSVQGDIQMYSDGNLYTASFPPTALDENSDRDVYIQVPVALNPDARIWVSDGRASGETVYGWVDQLSKCDPPGGIGLPQPSPGPATPSPSPNPSPTATPQPWVAPSSSTPKSVAKQLPPPDLSCATPAAEARVITPRGPAWPLTAVNLSNAPLSIDVIMSLDDTGHVADVTIVHPIETYKVFYDAAMRAAVLSTYAPARSMCKNIPSEYIFQAIFSP